MCMKNKIKLTNSSQKTAKLLIINSEKQPSKLWVPGSNPGLITKSRIGKIAENQAVKLPVLFVYTQNWII